MIYVLIVALLIAIDQLTKSWAFNNLRSNDSIVVIEDLLEFTYVENRGAAFGILQGRSMFFVLITLGVSFFLIYYIFKNYHTTSIFMKISLSLVLAGAVGNLIDRLVRGFVVDFIFVRFWGYYDFPVFNVADICVVVGAISLMLVVLLEKEKIR